MVLTTTDAGRVRTLAINRPEALNAMNNEVFAAIRQGLQAAAEAEGVAAVVITGTGRAFCAGQDLNEMLADENPGHTEWLLTSPSSDPLTGSMATETTLGLVGSLMSSNTRPASQLAR